MGLGKTVQTISLLLSRPPPTDLPKLKGRAVSAGMVDAQRTTLIIAPLALIRQWERELKAKVTKRGRLDVLVHHGNGRTKSRRPSPSTISCLTDDVRRPKDAGKVRRGDYDVRHRRQ